MSVREEISREGNANKWNAIAKQSRSQHSKLNAMADRTGQNAGWQVYAASTALQSSSLSARAEDSVPTASATMSNSS
jgi:uncharacterized membrane protein